MKDKIPQSNGLAQHIRLRAMYLVAGIILAMAALAGCGVNSVGVPGEKQPHQNANSWRVVDNFEQPDALAQWYIRDVDNQTSPYIAQPQVATIVTEAGCCRHYLKKAAQDGVTGNRKALSYRALPTAVKVGQVSTLFLRINVEAFPNNHSFGLSNLHPAQIDTANYDAFEPMLRITDKPESDGSINNGTLMVSTGHKNYARIGGAENGQADPLVPGSWYAIWVVINNRPAQAGGQTFDVYMRGGEFSHQQKVYSGGLFRMQRAQPLGYFITIANTGPAEAPYGNGGVRYDEIYLSADINLTLPAEVKAPL